MRIAPLLLKSSSSSSRWIARQSRDPYVKSRSGSGNSSSVSQNQPAYRSRSSFKLLSLAAKHPSLLGAGGSKKVIVDLGAAPGGWSQVVSHLTKGKGKVFALDILDIEPIPGVEVIKGDFLSEDVREQLRIRTIRSNPTIQNQDDDQDKDKKDEEDTSTSTSTSASQGMVDCVLSDMMAPMTGNKTRDISLSLQLCAAATVFARGVLKKAEKGEEAKKELGKGKGKGKKIWPGGNLIIKFFAHPDMNEFRSLELDPWFGKVVVEKPKESRSESSEAYWVCLGYKGDPTLR
ncbi:ribosomal RNA large subunit methyltransferase J [Kwoniella mangroviensis CBS 10435]|uniref:rRNA methyltransferase 2, mitochondrial n=1 Tax=Kwoniella mangroviensis CBS 10435 TaxID=1331196 RepID=A0A1B9IK50_9TREE|nr:ribosomal RNA large subunit methyltransferase J [Kwoniella mangroviensis CBS 8507]OCF55922.1 ribosomal RNA large subunit methyltransferase J [Kwoniella mangroviensis CBS 10435]OCF65697.1 ribosomal RNA large subunit methyltransferase J [Kwoniella mangroviensis CBS 8507]